MRGSTDPTQRRTWNGNEIDAQAISREYSPRIKFYRTKQLLLDKDLDKLMSVAKDESALRYVFEVVFKLLSPPPPPHRGRGWEKGKPRKSSVPASMIDIRNDVLFQAKQDVQRIKALFKKHWGNSRRIKPPTAVAMAARRNGLEPEELEAYLKSH
jgi:hypothetical protein